MQPANVQILTVPTHKTVVRVCRVMITTADCSIKEIMESRNNIPDIMIGIEFLCPYAISLTNPKSKKLLKQIPKTFHAYQS